jgi:hypothetical protein
MSTLKKKAEVIILESKDDNPVNVPFVRMPQRNKLVKHLAGGEFRKYLSLGFKPQHLYIVTDEEIKEGDWYYEVGNSVPVKKWDNYLSIREGHNWCKKIIAITDTSLKIEIARGFKGKEYNLPKPSNSFIEKFISEYNKGNIITDVMVEYEGEYDSMYEGWYAETIQPKVDRNNCITITRSKDTWNREEVIKFGLKVLELGFDLAKNPLPRLNDKSGKEYYFNWLKQNL